MSSSQLRRAAKHALFEAVLRRHHYAELGRPEKGLVRRFNQRPEPGPDDAPDQPVPAPAHGAPDGLPQAALPHPLHARRHRAAGPRRRGPPAARRAGHLRHPTARVRALPPARPPRPSGLRPGRHRAFPRAGRHQGRLHHQSGRPSHAMASTWLRRAYQRALPGPAAAAAPGTVPLRDPRLPFRQRQRVHQPHHGRPAGETAHRIHQVQGPPQQ